MKNFLQGLTLAAAITVSCFVATPVIFTACTTSQQRVTVNSLFTIGKTVDAAYRNYVDSVIAGTVKTNSVPEVSAAYNSFQGMFGAAVTLAALNTNAPPPVNVTIAADTLLSAIVKAKGTK